MAVQGDLVETYRDDFSRAVDPSLFLSDARLETIPGGSASSFNITGGVGVPLTSSGRWLSPKNFPSATDETLSDLEATIKVVPGPDFSSFAIGPIVRAYDVNNYIRGRLTTSGTFGATVRVTKVEDNVSRDLSAIVSLPAALITGNPYWVRTIASGNQLTAQVWNSPPPASGGTPYAEANVAIVNTNEVQTVAISGTPTGGNFTLAVTIPGTVGATVLTTAPINWNATAAQVASAVAALPGIGVGNVVGSGGPLPGGTVSLTFQGALANTDLDLVALAANNLTGGTTPTVTTATDTHGLSAAKWGAGAFGRTGIFVSGTSITTGWTVDDFVVREPLMPYTYWGNFDEVHDGTSVLLSQAGIELDVGDSGLLTRSQAIGAFAAYDLRAGSVPWTRTNFAWKKKR